MKSLHRVFIKLAAASVAVAIASVVFIQGSVLAGPCAGTNLFVNKVADTNDGFCTPEDCSLREAVVASNMCPGVQTIYVPAGNYMLTRTGAGEDAASTGDLDITGETFIETTSHPVFVDGNHADRVFETFPEARKVAIDGMIIQNGYAESGAGIHNQTDLSLDNDTIQNNTASTSTPGDLASGGGILSEGDGSLALHAVVVTGNSADQGGGVMVVANGTIVPTFLVDALSPNTTIIAENYATDSGGGLWLSNGINATLDRFEVSKNSISSGRGAGIFNAATLTLTRGRIIGNTGGVDGGGIDNEPAGKISARNVYVALNLTRMGGGLYNMGTALFYQSGFAYNEANRGQGGAIYNYQIPAASAVLILENATLSGNTGLLGGGAIRNEGGLVKINYSTLAYNSNDGINNSSGGRVSIRNSILAAHSSGNCVGSLPVSSGFNIDDGLTCGFSAAGDLVATATLLTALADNGGWSLTHALLPASPAIDSANPSYCIAADEREVPRPQGVTCDRGAYEYVP